VKISTLHLQKFGVHEDVTFELSPGVTLITADNGKGKTTLASALTWLVWGKLIRPLPLERGALVTGTEKSATPRTLRRRIVSQGELVDFDGAFTNSNKTRAAETLDPLFGQWDAWKRTLHVTGRTVSTFSQGTPKEKLAHLVAVTGASKFDSGLERLKAAEKEESFASLNLLKDRQNAMNRVSQDTTALDKLTRSYELVKGGLPSSDLASTVASLDARVLKGQSVVTKLGEHYSALYRLTVDWRAARLHAAAAITASKTTRCRACNSWITGDASEDLLLSESECLSMETIANDQANRMSTRRNETSTKLNALVEQLSSCRVALREAEMREEVLADIERRTYDALANLYESQLTYQAAHVATAKHEDKLATLEAAKSLLLRSRSRYLRRFAGGIESYSNHYLKQVGSDIEVRLVYEGDKLQIVTQKGRPYDTLSGGEQRRVDLCLILAMSQAAAETGKVPSSAPLIIDEAFDTLDADGVEALIYLACEVAKRRQVLLISHAEPAVPVGANVWQIKL